MSGEFEQKPVSASHSDVLKIILLSVLCACGYGVIHDQITVRICMEYFTLAHPPLFRTQSPALLALCWGVVATVGMGALLGLVLALIVRGEGGRRVSVSGIFRGLLILLAVMGGLAAVAGVVGYQLSEFRMVHIPGYLVGAIPVHRHSVFMAVAFAHGASYLVGLGGAVILCVRVWRANGRPQCFSLLPRTRGDAIRAGVIAVIAVIVLWRRIGAS